MERLTSRLCGIRGQRIPHTPKHFLRIRPVNPNYVTILTLGTPSCKHPVAGKSREDADKRDAAGGSHMLASGIVTHIELARVDDSGKPGERAFPRGGSNT
jgi:hypothetical protein